jgi:hypothetical protein
LLEAIALKPASPVRARRRVIRGNAARKAGLSVDEAFDLGAQAPRTEL